MEQLNIQITNDLRNRLNLKDWKATEELEMIVAYICHLNFIK